MIFQRNKKGYIEVEYEGNLYLLMDKIWHLSPTDVDWYSTGEGTKTMKFTIPINNISREEAEKEIKRLMKSYQTFDDFDFYYKKERKLQLTLDRLLRQEKLKQIYSYE